MDSAEAERVEADGALYDAITDYIAEFVDEFNVPLPDLVDLLAYVAAEAAAAQTSDTFNGDVLRALLDTIADAYRFTTQHEQCANMKIH